MDCDHNYQYQSVVYSNEAYPRPGSGAHDRIYEDKYYCTKCLDTQLRNRVVSGTSYEKPIVGTFPK